MEEFFYLKRGSIFCLLKMVEVDENTCSTQPIFRWILTLFFFLIFMTEFLFNTGANFIKKSCRGEVLTTIIWVVVDVAVNAVVVVVAAAAVGNIF